MVRKRTLVAWKSAAAKRLQDAAGNPGSVDAAISTLVTDLLRGIAHPPTDLAGLGGKLGVRSIQTEPLPASGELRRQGKDYVVVCSTDLPPARRRFTIAHEFGHILLERCGARQIKDNVEIERLCDFIASEMLLPRAPFLERSEGELTPYKILGLARTFDVSVMATARRCYDLRKANLFLVSGDDVEWGFGVVRRGPVAALDFDLRVAIEAAIAEKKSPDVVFINTGTTSGQWKATSAKLGSNAALFLLQPVPRSRARS